MNKKYLFLDDIRVPETVCRYLPNMCDLFSQNTWEIVRSYTDFVKWVDTNGLPYYISFDHDLADVGHQNEKTGLDCVKWLIDYCIDNELTLPKYFVHSQNPVGNENMEMMLKNFKKFQNVR